MPMSEDDPTGSQIEEFPEISDAGLLTPEEMDAVMLNLRTALFYSFLVPSLLSGEVGRLESWLGEGECERQSALSVRARPG